MKKLTKKQVKQWARECYQKYGPGLNTSELWSYFITELKKFAGDEYQVFYDAAKEHTIDMTHFVKIKKPTKSRSVNAAAILGKAITESINTELINIAMGKKIAGKNPKGEIIKPKRSK